MPASAANRSYPFRIEHKIRTLAELYEEPIEYDGIRFEQWDFTWASGPRGEAWLAIGEVESPSAQSAFASFQRRLLAAVDRIAFIGQVFADADFQSFVLSRSDGASPIYLRTVRELHGVGLPFGKEEIAALQALQEYVPPGDAFVFLSEACKATTYLSRLMMLASALEAIAGEVDSEKGRRTNREYIREEVLKDDDLYKTLYGYGTGVRNALAHGREPDFSGKGHVGRNYVSEVYGKILDYFSAKHGVGYRRGVTNPMRSPYGNYKHTGGWLIRATPFEDVGLRAVEAAFSRQFMENGVSVPEDETITIVGPPGWAS